MSRMIDADALTENILALPNCSNGFSDVYDKALIISVIEEMPTIEERKKGTWMLAFNGAFKGGMYWFECSECGRIVPDVRNGGWNFCPTCCAYMRGEDG